jgi:hypothetical protein
LIDGSLRTSYVTRRLFKAFDAPALAGEDDVASLARIGSANSACFVNQLAVLIDDEGMGRRFAALES